MAPSRGGRKTGPKMEALPFGTSRSAPPTGSPHSDAPFMIDHRVDDLDELLANDAQAFELAVRYRVDDLN